jgi:menaquinone-dependent protoporphyrinogen oxidase
MGMAPTTTTPIVPRIPVFFATTEGQTHAIAERLAAVLRVEGFDSRAVDVRTPEAGRFDWTAVRGAIVGASIHVGRHQREVAGFVDTNRAGLNARPSLSFSVSLSAASADAQHRAAAQALAAAFPPAHGWTPIRVVSVAGRLAYSKYGFFKRIVLKRIAKAEGAPTDTSRDYEFTDWLAVESLRGSSPPTFAQGSSRQG